MDRRQRGKHWRGDDDGEVHHGDAGSRESRGSGSALSQCQGRRFGAFGCGRECGLEAEHCFSSR